MAEKTHSRSSAAAAPPSAPKRSEQKATLVVLGLDVRKLRKKLRGKQGPKIRVKKPLSQLLEAAMSRVATAALDDDQRMNELMGSPADADGGLDLEASTLEASMDGTEIDAMFASLWDKAPNRKRGAKSAVDLLIDDRRKSP